MGGTVDSNRSSWTILPPASITGCTYRIANERSPDCKGRKGVVSGVSG